MSGQNFSNLCQCWSRFHQDRTRFLGYQWIKLSGYIRCRRSLRFKMNFYLEVFVFLFSYIHSIFAQTCSGPIQIKSDFLNKRMLNNTFLEKILPHHDCARLCMTYPMCKSINFNPTGNICELNRKSSSDIGSYTFQNAPRVIFTDIKDWPSVSIPHIL